MSWRHREPRLEDMLADSIVKAVMEADGVDPLELETDSARSQGRYISAPYGGWKQSGIGEEECFEEIASYTQVKNINMRWQVLLA